MGYYGLLWILDYHGIIIDSGLSLYYRGFWTVMVYHGLPWITKYAPPYSRMSVAYHGLLWIATYAPRASDDT